MNFSSVVLKDRMPWFAAYKISAISLAARWPSCRSKIDTGESRLGKGTDSEIHRKIGDARH